MPNPRGAPKGNLNALKHGFYSRFFHTLENSELPEDLSDLDHEITLLRVLIRRTMQIADGVNDIKDATRLLDSLGSAASRLAALLRVKKMLTNDRSGFIEELSIAIQQVNAELRRKK
jgi:hypothetical protein